MENRLRQVTGGPSTVALDYDAFGRLGTVTTGGTSTYYRYAGAQLAAEIAGGVYLRSHVSGQGTDEQWMSFEGPSTNPTPNPTWYLQDRLSSVIGVSDASGAITPYAYGPYGEPQSWSGSRFRYTGQIAIPEAQLYHYRARAYDPVLGRFLQTDPIGYDDGPNIYAYVHGDPVNGTDPSGELGAVDSLDLGRPTLAVLIGGVDVIGRRPVHFDDIAAKFHFDANLTMLQQLANMDLSNLTNIDFTFTLPPGAFTDPPETTPKPPKPPSEPPKPARCVGAGVAGGAVTYATLDYLATGLSIAAGASRGAALGGLFTVETGPGVAVGVVVGGLVGVGFAVAALASDSCF